MWCLLVVSVGGVISGTRSCTLLCACVRACERARVRVRVCVCVWGGAASSALFAQMLPLNLSPTSKYTTASTLAMVILFSMVREAFEDMVRHRPCGYSKPFGRV